MMVDLAPRRPRPVARRLSTIPLDVDKKFDSAAYAVSTAKLKQVANTGVQLRKKITDIVSSDNETLVSFQGGSVKKYSVVVVTDGPGNSLIGEAQKRRPSEPRHEIASVIIPRNEYDPDALIDLFAFGKRLIIFPISDSELHVSFHQISPKVPSSPLHRTRPITQLIENMNLKQDAEAIGSVQTVLQRIIDLPTSRTVLYANPRFFLKPIPSYHQGKIFTYPCRRQVVDVSGVSHSYQIEECHHIARAIATNSRPDDIGKAYKDFTKKQEAKAVNYCKKVVDTALYERKFSHTFHFIKTIISHKLFGRYKPRFYSATEPTIKP